MLRIYLTLAALVVLVAAFGYIRYTGAVAEREKRFKADVVAYQKRIAEAERVNAALDAQMDLLRAEYDKIKEVLANETAKPDYRCRVPADGVRILRQAVAGSATK